MNSISVDLTYISSNVFGSGTQALIFLRVLNVTFFKLLIFRLKRHMSESPSRWTSNVVSSYFPGRPHTQHLTKSLTDMDTQVTQRIYSTSSVFSDRDCCRLFLFYLILRSLKMKQVYFSEICWIIQTCIAPIFNIPKFLTGFLLCK